MQIIIPKKPNWDKIAVEVLVQGGVVVHPTDTAYGLAVDATNEAAIQKIFELKKRKGKPLIMVVRDQKQAREYVDLNPLAEKLMQKFFPGALALVLPKKETVPALLTGGLDKVGIRQPDHPVISKLSAVFPKPYTSTSANLSEGPTPYSVEEVLAQLDPQQIDLIIDAGLLPRRPTSTVVDLTCVPPQILREGVIAAEEILRVI